MNKLAVVKHALEVATAALELKRRQVRPHLRQAVTRELNNRQAAATERDLERVLVGVISKHVDQIISKVASGSKKNLLNEKQATKDIINAVAPILAVRMAEAARNQMLSVGLDYRKGRKDIKGDKPGHPFRGNQWSGGGSGDSGSDNALLTHQSMFGDDSKVRTREVLTSEIKRLGKLSRASVTSDNDRAAIRSYTDGKSMMFESLNNTLRTNGKLNVDEKNVDDALHRVSQTELGKPAAVYRGVQLSQKDTTEFISNCESAVGKNKVVQFNSYTSTSLSSGQARVFAVAPQEGDTPQSRAQRSPVMMEIIAKRGVYVTRDMSAKPEELELVMDRESKFRVLGVSKNVLYGTGNYQKPFTVIRMEQL